MEVTRNSLPNIKTTLKLDFLHNRHKSIGQVAHYTTMHNEYVVNSIFSIANETNFGHTVREVKLEVMYRSVQFLTVETHKALHHLFPTPT